MLPKAESDEESYIEFFRILAGCFQPISSTDSLACLTKVFYSLVMLEILIAALQLVFGFGLLIFGGDALVKAAVSVASRLSLPPALIAATIIAGGTSAPELMTSVLAAVKGSPDIAIANIIGSNIFNILAILGISALILPNIIDKQTSNFDYPTLVLACILMISLGWDLDYSRYEGIIFIAALIGFLLLTFRKGIATEIDIEDEIEILKSPFLDAWWLFLGLLGLLGGAQLALDGGVFIGQWFGLSERVIGITIISVGTGLPELATSAVAAYRGRSDIAVANVIGSNIMNILAVIGAAAITRPLGFSRELINPDIWVMFAATLILIPFMVSNKKRIGKPVGAGFLALYIGYVVYLLNFSS
jgi:cation:H+ antiporter